jgi:hypothetical protein
MMDEQDQAAAPLEPPVPMEDRDEVGTVRRRYAMAGGALQGVMETFDADGNPESRMSFRNGQLHGPATIFQAGRPAVEMRYVDGALDGEVRSFDPAGRLTAVTGFLTGKRSGPSLIYRPDGTMFRREMWEGDQMHGPVEEFNPDGSLLRRSTYVANMLHGEVLTFGAAGTEPERAPRSGRTWSRARR